MARTAIYCALLVFSLATPAMAEELYFGANPADLGLLNLIGLQNSTTYQVTDLQDGRVIISGELARFQTEEIDISGVHHFSITSSIALLAYLGWDCCGVGGSTFVPTEDGHARVGRAFLLALPVLGVQSDLVIYAVEDASVVIADTEGHPLVSHEIPQGRAWLPYPIVGATPYLLRSTGDVAVMVSAVNGLASVPPATRQGSCDSDVGREFYLNTHSWGSGGIAIFAYEPAEVTVDPIGGDVPLLEGEIEAGSWLYSNELGRRSYRVTSTGDISVWAGDMEGGSTIADMGDDFSFNLGRSGLDIVFHSQNHGATVFAAYDDTTIHIGEEEQVRQRGEWLDIESGVTARLTADRPVVVMTFGGNDLNDWGGFLRPTPSDPPRECQSLDADIPPQPDAGSDADADGDIDVPEDADPDQDHDDPQATDDSDVDAPIPPGGPRHSCDCRAVGGLAEGSLWIWTLLSLFGAQS
jgi:hypothetical protein